MTIQQMMLSGGSLPPLFIGNNQNSLNNVNSISVSTSSNTQIGDLILVFACSTNNGAHLWTAGSLTEVIDSNGVPNLWFGHTTAAVAGSTTYTISSSKTANLRVFAVSYRNAAYTSGAYTYAAPGSVSSYTIASATPVNANTSIVGFAVANQGSISWSVSNSPTTITLSQFTSPVNVLFRKDAVSTQQSFTISGMSGTQDFQAILVNINPA